MQNGADYFKREAEKEQNLSLSSPHRVQFYGAEKLRISKFHPNQFQPKTKLTR